MEPSYELAPVTAIPTGANVEQLQASMRLLDRIRDQEIVRTNHLGAETTWRRGQTVEWEGARYRVTRHKFFNTVPWGTYVVYGRRL